MLIQSARRRRRARGQPIIAPLALSRMDAEILRDMRDQATRLQRQTRRALAQLVAVLLRGSHTTDTVPLPRTKSWLRGVRQTQPASEFLTLIALAQGAANGEPHEPRAIR
jgi:hypothetical protein